MYKDGQNGILDQDFFDNPKTWRSESGIRNPDSDSGFKFPARIWNLESEAWKEKSKKRKRRKGRKQTRLKNQFFLILLYGGY